MANNIKLSVNAGLQNTWGVFSLKGNTSTGTGDAYDNIKVKVTVDGTRKVENSQYSAIHAGESNYKESEAIDPVLADSTGAYGWELNQYGSDFKDIIEKYFKDKVTSSVADADLYSNADAYKRYINQFNITFPDTNTAYQDGKYLDSSGLEQELTGHKYIEKTLNQISGTTESQWLRFNVDVIHFSKYYYIYKMSNINIPALRPLITTDVDLDKYNMAVTDNGEPFIRTMVKFYFSNDGNGDDGKTDLKEWQYDDINNYYDYDATPVVDWEDEFKTKYHDDKGHRKGYSMFKSSIRPSVYRFIDVSVDIWPQKLIKGFSLVNFDGESNMLNPKNGNGHDGYREKSLPTEFTSKYNQNVVTKYGFNNRLNDTNNTLYSTLWYYDDDEGNVRLFNTWFFLKKSHISKKLYQDIAFKSDVAANYPKTIGLALASLLANMLAYSGTDVNNTTYISDCIYLSDNTTSYSQDIIYDAEVTTQDPNSILLFNQVDYKKYLQQIMDKVGASNEINMDNVNATIRQCIKNCPLQMNMVYKEPNLDAINQEGNTTAIIDIEGNTQYVYNWKPEADTLYQVQQDNEGNLQAIPLNEFFTIKYLSKLEANAGKLKGTFSGVQEVNPYIHKMFKAEDNTLKFKTCKAYGSNNNYFSISNWNSDKWYAIRDIPKADILFPFGKVIPV